MCNFAISTVLGDLAVSFLCLIFLRWVLVGRMIAYKLLHFTPPLRLKERLRCKMPHLRLGRKFWFPLHVKLRKLFFNRLDRQPVEFRQSARIAVDQPFIVGPGFSPVPAMIVTQIVVGKYVDLSDLLAANLQLQQKDSEPQPLFNRRLVLTSHPKDSVVRFRTLRLG